MQFNLENNNPHSIESYGEHSVKINAIEYSSNIIVHKHEVIAWEINLLSDLEQLPNLEMLLQYNPEIILLGQKICDTTRSCGFAQQFQQQNIAVEIMSIGAACRTYNILLNEDRNVILGLIY